MNAKLKLICGKKIISPKLNLTRPTTLMVREALFNILRQNVLNSNWLDFFSGTGSISCEAINHGAKKVVAIEKNRLNAEICFKNIFSLDKSKGRGNDISVIKEDVISWIKTRNSVERLSKISSNETIFDFVYLDPPYESKYYELVLELLEGSKFINQKTIIICEHSKYRDFKIGSHLKIKDERVYGQTKIKFLVKV